MRVILTLGFAVSLMFAAQTKGPQAEVDAVTVPQLINYQGFLTNSSGSPLNGNFRINFALYGADSGGITLWSETHDPVAVTRGVFDVVLGSITSLPNVPDNGNLWLQVTVAGDVITPRIRMVSVPYAYHANNTGRLQGRTVSDAAPSSGQVLKWSGSAWAPAADSAGGGTGLWVDEGSYIRPTANTSVRMYDAGQTYGIYGYTGTTGGNSVYAYNGWNGSAGYLGPSRSLTVNRVGVYGYTYWSDDWGVYGVCRNTGVPVWGVLGCGNLEAGVYGHSTVTGGRGVYGHASAGSGVGVYGVAPSSGRYGVYGSCTNASGRAIGVAGFAANTNSYGVFGHSGSGLTSAGVYGSTNNGTSYGVYGIYPGYSAGALGGSLSGVYGLHLTPTAYGVYGTATNYGVYGRASSGQYGVLGFNSPLNAGVYGSSGDYGVYGYTSGSGLRSGVYGYGPNATGVFGYGAGNGVYGYSSNTMGSGVYGYCLNGGASYSLYGAVGCGQFDAGAFGYAYASGDYGVFGLSQSASSYAGYFANQFSGTNGPAWSLWAQNSSMYSVSAQFYNTGAGGTYLACAYRNNVSPYNYYSAYGNQRGRFSNIGSDGTFEAVVPTKDFGTRELYAVVSPEVWHEDFGSVRMTGGRARVELDPVFLQTASVTDDEPVKVFLQQTSGQPGLPVLVSKGATWFEVVGPDGAEAEFDYRVVVKRAGYEGQRLASAPSKEEMQGQVAAQ